MKTLTIKKIEIIGNSLNCVIDGYEFNGQSTISIKVQEKYAPYLCSDRADCFFIYCLYKAVKEDFDLVSEVPVSERLLYQATHYLMPLLCEMFNKSHINIKVSSIKTILPSQNAVGTGITGGVDSLYSIATHSNQAGLDSFNLTHLVLMNVGSHHIGAESVDELFANRVKLAESFCKEHGYEFVLIDTNVADFLQYDYTEYHGIVNQCTILSLQQLFRYYYCSSSYSFTDFKFNPYDLSNSELFNLAVLETNNTSFYSVGGEITRYEKVKLLTQYTPSYKYLNVCNSYSQNCSKMTCVKCMRTILELDALNMLDKYDKVFDIPMYEEHKMDYLADMYARLVLRHDHYAHEMWDDITKKYDIPFHKKIQAIIRFISSRMKMYSVKDVLIKLRNR